MANARTRRLSTHSPRQPAVAIGVAEVRSFADQMDEFEFWHKSYQEKNLAMREKLLAQRGRRAKSKINIAHISFSAWDPDRYLGWVDRKMGRFIYSGWCALAVIVLLVFESIVVVENWHLIGPDTVLFFNFAEKSLGDFAQFWLLILVIGFLHETAHGLTCKHFGGQVHSMGLMFLYLVPCFFVDVTESWISATKIQRLGTIMAGIWIELVMCGIAMIFWLEAPPGSWVHNLAYQVILLTGIAAVIINLNPLIKLDGYYFATEIIEIPDLKESSTAFLYGMVSSESTQAPCRGSGCAATARPALRRLRIYLRPVQLHSAFFCCPPLVPARLEVYGGVRPDPLGCFGLYPVPVKTEVPWQGDHASSRAEFSVRPSLAPCIRSCGTSIHCAFICASMARPGGCLFRD